MARSRVAAPFFVRSDLCPECLIQVNMKLAFLGLGKMGAPVVKHLLKSGHEVTVWNRTQAKAQPLEGEGAKASPMPSEAVRDADVVFSMLMDDRAVEEVVLEGKLAAAMPAGGVHVSLSTVSVELSKRLQAEHKGHDQEFVAAPVFGRPAVAEEGKLWIVAAGPKAAIERVKPILDQMGRGVTVISEEPWRAHALKLGGNFLITAMIESVSEALTYADAQGIDPGLFLETVNNALFQSPFYAAYGKVMLNPPENPGASIAIGMKDTVLFRQAAHAEGVKTPLADRFAADLNQAADLGFRDLDWAAGLYELARRRNLLAGK